MTVIERDYTRKNKGTYWWCKCDCKDKTIKSIDATSLKLGFTNSCGCLRKEMISLYNEKQKKKYNTYNLTGEYGIGYTFSGKEFYFDLEDYDLIKGYCWMISYGYICTGSIDDKNDKPIRMHRLVMNAKENEEVDHIFHNKNDNRKNKLRLVTHSKNQMNKSLARNNTSGVKGVGWDSIHNCWVARIQANNIKIHLGYYHNFDDAVKARKEAEQRYQGEYSYDNSMKSYKDNLEQEQNNFLDIS